MDKSKRRRKIKQFLFKCQTTRDFILVVFEKSKGEVQDLMYEDIKAALKSGAKSGESQTEILEIIRLVSEIRGQL